MSQFDGPNGTDRDAADPTAGDFRHLVARLSDGSLDAAEFRQLNDLLKADPIAQEMYLDHLLIDGLLEREFAGAGLIDGRNGPAMALPVPGFASGVRREAPRSRWRPWALIPATLLSLAALGWVLHLAPAEKGERHLLTLADASFEADLPRSVGKTAEAAWYGDVAHVVPKSDGITPLEGNKMLRFVRSTSEPERSCELYQIVDLSGVAELVASGSVAVEASAHFNAIEAGADEEYSFGLTVFAYSDDPAQDPQVWPLRWESPLTFSGGQTAADSDTESWQKVATRLSLPAGTRYLVVQLAAIRTDADGSDSDAEPKEFPGQFADRVLVSLVEP